MTVLQLAAGNHDLLGVPMAGVDEIRLTDIAATTVILSSAEQALLFKSSAGINDTVIFSGALTQAELAALWIAGIEQVQYVSGGNTVTSTYAGNPGAACGPLQQVVISDTDGNEAFASVVYTYANQVLASVVTTFDNGIVETALYTNGVRSQLTRVDPGNASIWASQQFTYAANGSTITHSLNIAHNGDTTEITYGLTSTTTVFADVSHSSTLASSTVTASIDGKPVSSVYAYDDGRVETRTYTNGILTKFESNDVNNAVSDYKTNTVFYDASGVQTEQLRVLDNNDTYDIFQSNGVLTKTIYTDGSHSASYNTYEVDFTNGVYTTVKTVFDNQLRTETYFNTSGVRTGYFQSDDGNVFNYSTVAINYKSDGSIANQVTTLDNGNRAVANNIDGESLTGGSFNDSLTGHTGADVFVFAPGGGNDYVSNFQKGVDKLDLRAFGLADFAAVRARTVANGPNGIYLTFAGGEHLAVNGLSLAAFDASDVITGNQPAVITGTSTAQLTETNAAQSTGGTLSATDVDSPNTFIAQTGVAGSSGYGTFSITAAGVWSYTMNNAHDEFVANTDYTDSITVTTADGTPQLLTVTIHGTNDAALITGSNAASLTESNSAQSTGGTLVATDVDGPTPSFVAQTGVAGSNGYGSFSITAAGAWSYTMNSAHDEFVANTAYTDSITVATVDGTTRQITVTITGTNDGPVLDLDQDDSSGLIGSNYSTTWTEEGGAVAVVDSDVSVIDADGSLIQSATVTLSNAKPSDVLAVTAGLPAGITSNVATQGGQITVTLSGPDTLSNYQNALKHVVFSNSSDNPDSANRSVSVVVNDGTGNSNTALSTITVVTVNDAPVALPSAVTQAEDTVFTFSASNFHFSDAEGDALASVNVQSGASHGTLFLDSNSNGLFDSGEAVTGPQTVTVTDLNAGLLKFVADPNANGQAYATFDYRVNNGIVSPNPATMTVNVTPVNDAPDAAVFTPANAALPEGSAVGVTVGAVTGSDIDNASNALSFSLVNDDGTAYSGPLAINSATGVITVSGDIDFESTGGQLEPTVRVTDPAGLFSDTVITVAIADQPEIALSAIEGYIANATIYVDDNNNGTLDAGDYVTHSNAVGAFSITGTHTGAIYLLGGNGATDTATGAPFNGVLKAAPGSTVLSPLTTLIAELAASPTFNGDVAAATSQVVAALGLPTGVDPNTFDPIVAALSDNPTDQAAGAQLFAAGVQVYNTIVQAASLITGAANGSVDTQSAGSAVLAAIVDQVASATGTVSLSDTSTLSAVISSAATTTATNVSATVSGAANVISGSNTLIDSALANPTATAADLLQAVAGTATIAQGDAAQALAVAGQTGSTASAESAFTGANLDSVVTTATAAVDTNALAGPSGDNTLVGTAGADVLDGAGGNDIIYAGGGRDTLIGGSGNDLLDGDTLDGNQNNRSYAFDRADYSAASEGIAVDLASGVVTGGPSTGTDTLRGVEGVIGSNSADSYTAVNYTANSDNNGGLGLAVAGGFGVQGAFNEFEGLSGNDTITGNGNTRVSYEHAQAAVKVNLSGADKTVGAVLVAANSGSSVNADDANVGVDSLGGGVNEIRGSAYNDILIGSALNASSTSEIFDGRGGDDYIDGNGGFDRVRYDNLNIGNGSINVQLAAGTVTGTDATSQAAVGTDTLRSIESVRGSSGADVFNAVGFLASGSVNSGGDQGNFNEFEGMAGNDTITGNGNTRVSYVNASAGVTVTLTGNGQGTATGNSSVGTDTFLGGVTAVRGSSFNDTLIGSNNGASSFEIFEGWAGDDLINGGGGGDRARYDNNAAFGLGLTLTTGLNFDMDTGLVTVNGADASGLTLLVYGNDTLRGIEAIRGTSSADVYDATGFTATSANAGDMGVNNNGWAFNEFEGMGGNDTIIGNTNTRISYQNALAGVVVNLSGSTQFGAASNTARGLDPSDIAQVGVDTLVGGISAVRGSNFNDDLIGSAGNDSFEGMSGSDFINGNGGFDLARYENENLGGSGIAITMSAGGAGSVAAVAPGFGTDTLQSIESVRGTNADDTYNASAFAGGSNGTFNDFEGMGGNDTVTGNGNTRVSYTNATGGVSVTLTSGGAGTATGSGIGTDTFVSGVSQINGSNFDDVLTGNGSANTISGNRGNDVIVGGAGNDVIDGGAGVDVAVFSGSYAAYTLTAITNGYTVVGPDGTDTVTNVELLKFDDGYLLGMLGTVNLSGLNATGDSLPVFGSINDDTVVLGDGSSIGNHLLDLGGGANNQVTLSGSGPYTLNLANVQTLTDGANGNTITVQGATAGMSVNLGDGNETINGGFSTSSSINGGNGADTITYASAAGAVSVDLSVGAASGASIADSLSNFETVIGSSFSDTLTGDSGNNTLIGNDGVDLLTGNAGNDTLNGGLGVDRANYSSASEAISVNLAAGIVTGGPSSGTDTLNGVEGVRGTAYDDVFDATGFTALSTNNGGFGITIAGGFGAQGSFSEFEGMGGNDTITGNGNTRVNYEHAAGSVSVNLALGTADGDASVGHDTITGGVTAIRGSAFDDTLIGMANSITYAENFEGFGGNDYIDGNGGFDRARYDNQDLGGLGINVNLGSGIVTSVANGYGTDTLRSIEAIRGTNAADTYDASTFNATSTNGGGVGDQGNFNEFEGMGGNDIISGNGNTRISYVNAASGVTVNLSTATATGTLAGDVAKVGSDIFAGPAVVGGYAYGIAAVRGSNFNDTLIGFANATNITETFEGWSGDDFINGNGGFDRVRYDNNNVLGEGVPLVLGVDVELSAGTVTGRDATASFYYGTDTLQSIESVRGSSADDIYNATGFATNSGNNRGDAGANGTIAFNEFEGMGGNDQVTGNGNTRVTYQSAGSGVSVDLLSGTADGTSSGHDTFLGGLINGFNGGINAVRGSNYDDVLLGSNNANNVTESFDGGAGNDTIDGRGGFDLVRYDSYNNGLLGIAVNMAAGTVVGRDAAEAAAVGSDTLLNVESIRGTNLDDIYDASSLSAVFFNEFEGMGGNDLITGNGNTRVSYNNSSSAVTVTLTAGGAGSASGAAIGNDTFAGGVAYINGSGSADTLTGNSGANTINGNGGNDRIDGGGGNDTLTGGAGNDTFVFNAGFANGATVTDFVGNGASVGDSLEFHGFGTAAQGATLTFISGGQWQVHSGLNGTNEIITLTGSTGSSVHSSDVQFL